MNVAAIKQVVPYAKFLVRASMEKRRPSPDAPAAPPPAAAAAQLHHGSDHLRRNTALAHSGAWLGGLRSRWLIFWN